MVSRVVVVRRGSWTATLADRAERIATTTVLEEE
jgi:hypothetical protein